MDISTLKNFLIPLKEKMVWDFLRNNSNYDWALCDILWMQEDTWRYWDAQWNGYKIEFKKWTSIWLDLIRYSEIVLWTTDNANNETITLFFIPDKDKLKIMKYHELYRIKTLSFRVSLYFHILRSRGSKICFFRSFCRNWNCWEVLETEGSSSLGEWSSVL